MRAVIVSTALTLLASLALLGSAPVAAAQPGGGPAELCRMNDKRIGELSGLVSDGSRWYATNDGGTRITVWVLGRDCKVERTIANPTDPLDVEDLARDSSGALWLADIGDNQKKRPTVALHKVTPDGGSVLYRLSYPDGPRDAEALLLGRDGVPYVVTKAVLGPAGVYRPAGPLTSPGPTALARVGDVRLNSTDTPGGPPNVPHSIGSGVVTGGAVSADGMIVAIRTYTDAYLYSAPDGNILAALGREPVRVPLPNEPQGEAIAFAPDGTLLSASEGVGQPIRAVADAVARVPRAATAAPVQEAPAAQRAEITDPAANPVAGRDDEYFSDDGVGVIPGIGIAVAVIVGLVLFGRRRK